jgi:hypothetical protein
MKAKFIYEAFEKKDKDEARKDLLGIFDFELATKLLVDWPHSKLIQNICTPSMIYFYDIGKDTSGIGGPKTNFYTPGEINALDDKGYCYSIEDGDFSQFVAMSKVLPSDQPTSEFYHAFSTIEELQNIMMKTFEHGPPPIEPITRFKSARQFFNDYKNGELDNLWDEHGNLLNPV